MKDGKRQETEDREEGLVAMQKEEHDDEEETNLKGRGSIPTDEKLSNNPPHHIA